MDLKNCKRCGKLHYGTGRLCAECMKKEEEKFVKVKAYLKEFPNSSMVAVSHETGVSVPEIERFLREGRLEVTNGICEYLKCMKCGRTIKTGKYCAECEKKVMSDMQKTVVKVESPVSDEKVGPKMHHKVKFTK